MNKNSGCGNSCFLVILGFILLMAGTASDEPVLALLAWICLITGGVLFYKYATKKNQQTQRKRDEDLAVTLLEGRRQLQQHIPQAKLVWPEDGGAPEPPSGELPPDEALIQVNEPEDQGNSVFPLGQARIPERSLPVHPVDVERKPAETAGAQASAAIPASAPPLPSAKPQPGVIPLAARTATAPVSRFGQPADSAPVTPQTGASAPTLQSAPTAPIGLTAPSRFSAPEPVAQAIPTPALPPPTPPQPAGPAGPGTDESGKFSYQPKLVSSRFGQPPVGQAQPDSDSPGGR